MVKRLSQWVEVNGVRSSTIRPPGPPPDLADAVRRVRDGDAVFSPSFAGLVLDAFASQIPAEGRPRARPTHHARARDAAPDRPRFLYKEIAL